VLSGLGYVYNEIGERQKALDHYSQALPLLRAVGDREGEAVTLNHLGLVHNELGDKQRALEHYNQALTLLRAVGNRWREAQALNDLGYVYNDLGERQRALECYNQALRLARDVGDRNYEVMSMVGIARLEAAQGNLFDARSTIESALNIIESLRTKIVSLELRSSSFATAKNCYEFSIDLLMRLHRLRPDEGYDRAALQTVERARARSLLERLAEARLEIRSGADPALLERALSLRQLLTAKTERQTRLLNSKRTDGTSR
jgi:tetratricopeptide (TPR) repeat protein